MKNFFQSIWDSIKRIKILVKLQFMQKYKFATSVKKLIFTSLFTILISVAIVFALKAAMQYFNFVTAFAYDENVLGFILFIFFVISLISALTATISQIYNSTDNEFLFATPVKAEEVFISKLLIVIFKEFFSSLFIFLPILIGFGVGASNSVFGLSMTITYNYYIVMVFISIIIPLLAVALAVLISIPIYLSSQFLKLYTSTKFISLIVLFALGIFAFNWFVDVVISGLNYLSQLPVLATKLSVFLFNFSKNTVVFKLLANMFNGQYLYLFLAFVIALVLFVLAYIAIKPLYFKIVLSPSRAKYRKKRNKLKQNKPTQSIIKKDLNMLFSSGGDFFKYFATAIIVPFFLIVLNKIFGINEISLNGTYMILATNILMIAMFTCMNCSYTASSLTIEGSNFYIMQTTPISLKKQLYSKLLINFVINVIIILACCLIMYFTTPVKFAWTILAFFVTLLANFGFLCHTLQVEMQKPMIDWHDKAEITSHKNVSKCTLRGLLIGIVLGAFAFKFYLIAPQRAWFELLILAFLFAVYNVYTLLRRQNYLLKQINK